MDLCGTWTIRSSFCLVCSTLYPTFCDEYRLLGHYPLENCFSGCCLCFIDLMLWVIFYLGWPMQLTKKSPRNDGLTSPFKDMKENLLLNFRDRRKIILFCKWDWNPGPFNPQSSALTNGPPAIVHISICNYSAYILQTPLRWELQYKEHKYDNSGAGRPRQNSAIRACFGLSVLWCIPQPNQRLSNMIHSK